MNSQRISAGVGYWDKRMSGEDCPRGKASDQLGIGTDKKKKQSQVIFHRCRGETGRLYQEEPVSLV